jgi:hypothetical protein
MDGDLVQRNAGHIGQIVGADESKYAPTQPPWNSWHEARGLLCDSTVSLSCPRVHRVAGIGPFDEHELHPNDPRFGRTGGSDDDFARLAPTGCDGFSPSP